MKTGFVELDKIIEIEKPKLIVVASRSGMGQTSLALNIATNILSQNIPVLIFRGLEDEEEINNRILSSQAMVSIDNINKGKLRIDDWIKITQKIEPFFKFKKYITTIDNGNNILEELKEKCIKMKKEKKIKFVIIDNFEIISDWIDIKEQNIIEQLKEITKELEITILLNVEISRDIDIRDDKRPKLKDIKNQDIIKFGNIIMLLYRDEFYYEDSDKQGIAEILVAQNDDGITDLVELIWLKKYKKFIDL